MDLIIQGIIKAFRIIVTFDPEVFSISFLSLRVSGLATIISLLVGISVGTLIALTNFRGKDFAVSIVNAGMGLPPTVVGLFVSIFLWRSGVFGVFKLLYTPSAMVIAQSIIAIPIVTGLTIGAIQNVPPGLRLQTLALGATKLQMVWTIIKEARLPLMAAVMAGFGRVISEVGASIMVGGNVQGFTRVLTTATVMETGRGDFEVAIALSIILLILVYLVNFILTRIQQRERPR